ncbi:MAG TPA: hypothetical protein VL860_10125 [Planctomycetota bacterium]|nr:hypothetical protein [Planctomycetota bacterium]
MKKSDHGKTKGKTKPVDAVRGGRKGDTGKVIRARRGTNPIVMLIVLPLVLGGGGFLAWYYHQYGHFPLFVTEEQRQASLENAKKTLADIEQTTLDKWKVTKEQLDKWDKKYSAEYEEYQKNQAKKRQEMAFLLDEPPAAPPPVVRKPATRYVPPPAPIAPAAPVTPVRPVTAPTPTAPVTPAAPTTPKPTVPATPAPTQPVETPKPVETPVETPKPVETPAPPPKPAYDPVSDANYKTAADDYETAFNEAAKGDSGEGDAAIKAYTMAVSRIKSAADGWKKVADKCKAEGVASDSVEKNVANCDDNRKIWEENIANLKKAAEAPPPAAGSGPTGSGFYDKNPNWIEGKKAFKEGFDIFNDHISKGTGQSSHVLNGYIDKAVVQFNKAEELWTKAEDEWLKKFPGNSGNKEDAKMLDKAMGESQFFRYGCMKMHTFER